MDALSGLFRGPRAQGAFTLRMVMQPPWSVEVRDEAPLTLVAVVSGSFAVESRADGVIHQIGAGQVVMLRGPDHYVMYEGDAVLAERGAEIIVHPGQHCVDRLGRSLEEPLSQGVRTWGNDPAGDTTVLLGAYETMGETGRSLLALLPPVAVVDTEAMGSPIVDLLAAELSRDVPGQEVVLDRLLDLLTVAGLRAWFDRPSGESPSWWRAAADPVIGPALRLLHHQIDHPWTIALLANEVGVSRATLARRFNDLVGVPPMTYLAERRIDRAADLLAEPGATVDAVARRVGYGTGFALSAAFKRQRGCSPSEHRALMAVS